MSVWFTERKNESLKENDNLELMKTYSTFFAEAPINILSWSSWTALTHCGLLRDSALPLRTVGVSNTSLCQSALLMEPLFFSSTPKINVGCMHINPPFQTVTVGFCYLTRVTSHPFEWGWAQQEVLCFCQAEHLLNFMVAVVGDKISKCATYTLKQVLVWLLHHHATVFLH